MSNGQWRKRILAMGLLCTAVLWPTAVGAQEDVNSLKAELEAQKHKQAELTDRINQLEARQKLKEKSLNEKIEQATAVKPQEKKKEDVIPESLKWASKLTWSGDLRYRYEYIDDDGADSDERHRNRIRARLGLGVKVNDEWDLGFRIATGNGEVSGDPVSTNQTLDEAFSRKPFWLDQAYFGYHPQWFKGFNVLGGKMENPFYKVGKNELIWDSDLTPEGVALTYGLPLCEKTTLTWAAGGFWVNEESSGGDTSLWGLQGHVKHQFSKPTYLLGGAGWYDYGNIQGEESLADEWNDDNDGFFGNTPAAGDVFALDYDLFELFAEFGTEIAKRPVAIFGNYVQNTAARDDDTGWLVGLQVNKAKDPGSWQFEWDYRDLERDAVVGQFTSSDFIGGGAGGEGHRFAFGYVLAKNVAANLAYYRNEFDRPGIEGEDYDRFQFDVAVKF
ncbi:MAG TPA: putative porin [Sedimentisphaerales bacterium]|nr:putative porin [Sedimentisphaerales bacterium]